MYYRLEFRKNIARPLFMFNFMFMIGYYNNFKFVWRQIIFRLLLKIIESIIIFITWSINAQCSWHWTFPPFSNLISIVFRHYFTKVKKIFIVFTLSRSKKGRKIMYISKKRRFYNVKWHITSSESNSFNTSNSDNVIGYSNLLCK